MQLALLILVVVDIVFDDDRFPVAALALVVVSDVDRKTIAIMRQSTLGFILYANREDIMPPSLVDVASCQLD